MTYNIILVSGDIIDFITESLYPFINLSLSLLLPSPVTTFLLSVSKNSTFFPQYSTCKWYHVVFIFLCLAYFTLHCALQIHPYCHKWQDFLLFKGWIIFHYLYLYIYSHISHFLDPFICLQTLRLFHTLSIVNNAAMSIRMQISL